jgi:hypothetical protein
MAPGIVTLRYMEGSRLDDFRRIQIHADAIVACELNRLCNKLATSGMLAIGRRKFLHRTPVSSRCCAYYLRP